MQITKCLEINDIFFSLVIILCTREMYAINFFFNVAIIILISILKCMRMLENLNIIIHRHCELKGI